MSNAAAYRKNYYKKKKKQSYKINSNVEDKMVGRIINIGGAVIALHNNWSDTRKYTLGAR